MRTFGYTVSVEHILSVRTHETNYDFYYWKNVIQLDGIMEVHEFVIIENTQSSANCKICDLISKPQQARLLPNDVSGNHNNLRCAVCEISNTKTKYF